MKFGCLLETGHTGCVISRKLLKCEKGGDESEKEERGERELSLRNIRYQPLG